MAKTVKLSQREHPLYADNSGKWELYKTAVLGGTEFMTEDNIFTHRLEDSTDYDERVQRAYYLNYCGTVLELYNTFIFKERVERPADRNLDMLRRNTDGRYTNISKFVQRVGFAAGQYGAAHALLSEPVTAKQISRKQVIDNNLGIKASILFPYQLKDWSVDRNGELNWVVIEFPYYMDEDPLVEREELLLYKCITKAKWWIEDRDGNKPSFKGAPNSGTNSFGFVPLVTMYHKDIDNDLVGESLLKDIVYINRAILNWSSCIDEQIERQTFSQLVFPDDGSLAEEKESGGDPIRKMATTRAMTFPADAGHPPQFISPNTGNITVIWDMVIDHAKEIFRLAKLIGSSEDMYSASSGRAAQFGFITVNSALSDKARVYEKFENDICRMYYNMMGISTGFQEVKYAESFDIAALADEIGSIFKVMSLNMSTTLNKELQKRISRKALPTISEDIRQVIEDEIDAGPGIIDIQSKEEKDDSKDDGSGNPNSNQGKTFRTKQQTTEEETQKKKKV